ncbi:MAG TPA: hypothetical protein VF502_13820 [Stellaceae bacterium]
MDKNEGPARRLLAVYNPIAGRQARRTLDQWLAALGTLGRQSSCLAPRRDAARAHRARAAQLPLIAIEACAAAAFLLESLWTTRDSQPDRARIAVLGAAERFHLWRQPAARPFV